MRLQKLLPHHTLSGVCFLPLCITMMSDQEQFNIPIYLTNELYR